MNFCKAFLLIELVGVMYPLVSASDAPPMPSLPEDSFEEEMESDGCSTNVISNLEIIYTDDVNKYISYDWQRWDSRVRAWFDGEDDGGWSFSMTSTFPIIWERLYEVEEANEMATTDIGHDTFQSSPVFSATEEMLNPSTNPVEQLNERYRILAYRIPALSPAMGSCAVNKPQLENYMLNPINPSKWRKGHTFKERWLHSDIKNMPYQQISTLFDDFKSLINHP